MKRLFFFCLLLCPNGVLARTTLMQAATLVPADVAPLAPLQGVQRIPEKAESADTPANAPTDLAQLTERIRAELNHPALAHVRASVTFSPLITPNESPDQTAAPLLEQTLAIRADTPRVPASNAKLYTATAAIALLPHNYRFVTELARSARGRSLYIRGTGDPLLSGHDIVALARQAKRRGIKQVRNVVVDDSFFSRRRLAPGFGAFTEGSRYRPTSAALNVDSNSVRIRVSAPDDRRRPKVEIEPPSDYVTVRKRVRFVRSRKRRARPRIHIDISRLGSSRMLVTVSGTMPRRARAVSYRRAVFDPAMNVGWALRRALKNEGIAVTGAVLRGHRPKSAKTIATRTRSLAPVLHAVVNRSDNLAAETLVRTIAAISANDATSAASATNKHKRRRNGWALGLARISDYLHKELQIDGFVLKNGSGLHRQSRATAESIVSLLQTVYGSPKLRSALLPTFAVAGKSGTLRRRFSGTVAEGILVGKTGTLGNALALSGYILPEKQPPFAFSILFNGPARRTVRARLDAIAVLLARFATEDHRAQAESKSPRTPCSNTSASSSKLSTKNDSRTKS